MPVDGLRSRDHRMEAVTTTAFPAPLRLPHVPDPHVAPAAVADVALRLVQVELVAAAILRLGALHIRDPHAVLLRIVDRLAGGDALALHGFGVVEEPVELALGVVWVPRVGA